MSIIEHNPTAQAMLDLSKGIKYNMNYDTLETYAAINSTAAVTCTSLNVGTTVFAASVTAPTMNSSTIYTAAQPLFITGNGCQVTSGDFTLGSDQAYVNFHSAMMRALYASIDEKDQEFCMPSTKSKLYLGQLINHMNEQDSEKILRVLYYVISNMPATSPDLPSPAITASILEFAVKESV